MAPPSVGIPRQVGRYVLLDRLGEGGMGVVLRAIDPSLDREVAVKLLHARAQPDSIASTTRMLREAQALARLSHPNVIDVYDVGIADGRVFIAMEYVRGQTLREWLHERPARPEVIDAFVQAGRGLVAAHEAGLVHRDFKPANVLRGDDGRVRVVDFGLAAPARASDGSTLDSHDGHALDLRMTATGCTVGTPTHMSPEAHRGEPLDAKSDQWSFCVSLYEALYGERPYRGIDTRALAEQVHRGPPRPPREADVPLPLRDLIVRGLSVDPEDRWPSMAVVIERLQRPRARPWRTLAIALVVTTGAGGLVLPFALGRGARSCDPAADAVAEVWGATHRSTVHEAFSRSGASFGEPTWERIGETLDAHALALARARREACEATTRGASAERIDRQAACLGERLSELRGVVEVLEQADAATVRNAIQIVGDLRPPSECDTDVEERAVPSPPPSLANEVARVRDDMARARAQRRAGHYDRARELGGRILISATDLGYPPLLGEAHELYGLALSENGEYEAGEKELVEAQLVAQATGYDALVASASTELVFVVGVRLRRPDDAERWVRHARAAIERLPDPTKAESALDGALGTLRQAGGDFAAARPHYERALAANLARLGPLHPETLTVRSNIALGYHYLGDNAHARALFLDILADRIEVYGPDHPEVSGTYGNLGVVEQTLGELVAAAEHTQRALDGLEASVGRDHPDYPQLLTNLANTRYLMGDLDEALHMHARAKELLVQSLGPRAFQVGRSLTNMGTILARLGRNDEARRAQQEALEIFEEHLRPDHPELATVLANLAEVDRETGRLDDAMAGFDRALALAERAFGPEHAELAYPLAGRGQTHLVAGRPEPGIADLRRAVALMERAHIDPEGLAHMRQALAMGLWDTGARVEGRQTMEQVRREAESLAAGAALIEDVDRWLDDHRDP